MTYAAKARPPQLLIMLVVAIVGCSAGEREQATPGVQGTTSIDSRVAAIRAGADRIDDEAKSAEASGRLLTKELPHWEFTGFLDQSTPRLLNARFTEGQVVREESYYHVGGTLRLVKVDQWWDVDDSTRAPEPPTRTYFYIENGRTIRSTHDVLSSSPITQSSDVDESAEGLANRSRSIGEILSSTARDASMAQALETFPELERVKR
jgi:hypothetical protein